MRKHLGYFVFVGILVAYSIVQTTSCYKVQKSDRAVIQSELEHNLKSLEKHPLDISLAEYDKKYDTTLSSYNLAQPEMAKAYAYAEPSACLRQNNCSAKELITYTKHRIKAKNDEPFWSLDAIMKCFVYPLLAGLLIFILGPWISKKLRIQ